MTVCIRTAEFLPPPANGEIHVWHVASTAELAYELEPFLSEDERRKAERLRSPREHEQVVVGRGMLRSLLGRYLDRSPAALRFVYATNGKPELADRSVLRFNVSHSGGMVLLAVANEFEIGVDVEFMNTSFEFKDVAAQFFSRAENAALGQLPVHLRRHAFFRIWTRKEALVKANGKGISALPDEFQIPALAEATTVPVTALDRQQADWFVMDLPIESDYAAATASQCRTAHVVCRPWAAAFDHLGVRS